MKKKLKTFTAGYFTDLTARTLLGKFEGGHVRPAAIHIEPQSLIWLSTADAGSEDLDLGHHAEACTRLLAGAPAAVGAWDAGCLDEEMK